MDCRIDVNLSDHPKMLALKRTHGIEGQLSLIWLWTFVARVFPEGTIKDMSDQDIAEVSKYKHDASHWISRLIELKFLDQNKDGSYHIHDWSDHNNFCATRHMRHNLAKRAVAARWEKREQEQEVNTERITKRNAKRNTPPPSPSPSPNNLRSVIRSSSDYSSAFVPLKGIVEKQIQDWRTAPHPMANLPTCSKCTTSSMSLDLDDQGVCWMCRRSDEKTH